MLGNGRTIINLRQAAIPMTATRRYDNALKRDPGRKKISCALTSVEVEKLMQILAEEFPNPKSALEFKNPFELLCAVVLSAQATDASVNLATPALFKAAPDAKSMAELGEEGIAPYIKKIGLWRAKSKNLAALSKILCEKYGGDIPDSFDELIALPGVGSKTANVVLNVAFGHPTIAVDTHIFRVCVRTGLCPLKNAREVEQALPAIIPEQHKPQAHHRLLFHGRYVCTARNPKCQSCVINAICRYKNKTTDGK